MAVLKNRTGEISYNRFGTQMIIVEYAGADDITIEFQDTYKYKTKVQYQKFIEGSVRNPYDKSVYGVGYFDVGSYTSISKERMSFEYMQWSNMLQRCYDKNYQRNFQSYVGCSVVEEWHSFQNFAKWCTENYYQADNKRMELDKDILIKGNKIYSPETCVFVPGEINRLLINKKSVRGEYPVGVHLHKKNQNFISRYSMGEGRIFHIGSYNTPEEAFKAYKLFKEDLIKQRAEQYKEFIPYKLYNALINYQVNITD